jgi:hypothetical protein
LRRILTLQPIQIAALTGLASAYTINAGPEPVATFSNLFDFTGSATSIGFNGFSNPSSDALRKDYSFLDSLNNPETSLDWAIAGLIPGATYPPFAYGGNGGPKSFCRPARAYEYACSSRATAKEKLHV